MTVELYVSGLRKIRILTSFLIVLILGHPFHHNAVILKSSESGLFYSLIVVPISDFALVVLFIIHH